MASCTIKKDSENTFFGPEVNILQHVLKTNCFQETNSDIIHHKRYIPHFPGFVNYDCFHCQGMSQSGDVYYMFSVQVFACALWIFNVCSNFYANTI